MNGAHDMGGVHGFGSVVPEVDEPVFHAEWERRVFGFTLAAAGLGEWNIDQSRFSRENTPPQDYLDRSYYEMWLFGLQQLMIERGLITADEVTAAEQGATFEPVRTPPLKADQVAPMLAVGNSASRTSGAAASFAVGDTVEVSMAAPLGHTRAPRYVRGRTGVIDRIHGVHVFPDSNAAEGDERPQPVYSVRFEANELWGADAQGGAVYVDLWDDHLNPADS